MAGYEYVQRAYGVAPVAGGRVRHTETGKVGTIAPLKAGMASHYVHVTFDGHDGPLPCHPAALDYAPKVPCTACDGEAGAGCEACKGSGVVTP